jgi:RNA recognition motif. (a.k.a. RRM, RBD, or RNP domain)
LSISCIISLTCIIYFTVTTFQVKSIKIIKNKQTGRSEGYGFVEFATRATAERVLQIYTGQTMPNVTQLYCLDWATYGSGKRRGLPGDNFGDDYTIFVGDLDAEVTLSSALHWHPNVVANKRRASQLTQSVHRKRKIAKESRFHFGSWNVGSLIGKIKNLVDIMIRRHVNILCIQEAKWTSQMKKEVEDTGFRLWYTRKEHNSNGVGILIDKSLKNRVLNVKRQGNRIILVKQIVCDLILNVISIYTSQIGLSDTVKRQFWKDLDDMVGGVPGNEKLFIGGNFNGHIGTTNGGFKRVHGGFGYGNRNQEREDVLNFVVAYDLMIVNIFFRKKQSHLITLCNGQHSSQINFILTRRKDNHDCLDCKVISKEFVDPQHKLVVSDFHF